MLSGNNFLVSSGRSSSFVALDNFSIALYCSKSFTPRVSKVVFAFCSYNSFIASAFKEFSPSLLVILSSVSSTFPSLIGFVPK